MSEYQLWSLDEFTIIDTKTETRRNVVAPHMPTVSGKEGEKLRCPLGFFFPWDIVSLLPWDALSLVRFVCGTFCPVGRFVPWGVLSLGPYVGKLMSLGRFVPWDVLSRGTFCPVEPDVLGTFCLCTQIFCPCLALD